MNFPSLSQSKFHKSSLNAFIYRVAGCFENTMMVYHEKRWKEFYTIFLKDKNFRSTQDLYNNPQFTREILYVLKDAIKDFKFYIEPNDNDVIREAIRENNNRITTFLYPLHFVIYLNRQQRRYKINPKFMEQLMTFYKTHYGATFSDGEIYDYEYNMNKLYVLTLELIINEGFRDLASIDYDVLYVFNKLKYIAFSYLHRVLEKNLTDPIVIDKDEKLHEKSNEECIICLDKKKIRILCNTCNECKLCYMCAEKIKEKCPCCRTNNFKKIQHSTIQSAEQFFNLNK